MFNHSDTMLACDVTGRQKDVLYQPVEYQYSTNQ